MEIDKAIRESEDTRLKAKYNNALFVIQSALSLYSIWEAADTRNLFRVRSSFGFTKEIWEAADTRNLFRLRSSFGFTKDIEEVAFSFNGGKDSTVLLHLLRAGYFLYRSKQSDFNADLTDGELGFPIRTIYFESPSAFPEINSFTHDTASTYHLQLDIIRLDFKSGLEALLKEKPIKAIFLGVRIGDPTAVGQEQFSPSSPGWPAFMRVNPILDWSYRDVWAFLLTCKVQYCSLYDQGYTSIGSIYDTVQNSLLCINNDKSNENFRPAYLLSDGRLERAGRTRKVSRPLGKDLNNDLKNSEMKNNGMLTASVIAVGDEILFGTIEDRLGPILCRKLSSIGWAVSHIAVVRNDIDSVAEEVARLKSSNDMVFIHGGIGPLHSDITVAGIAKAFGVRMAPDEEFEEYLRHLIDDKCPGDHNEMAQLPEGITELLHHEKLRVPLIKCQNVIILSATNITELERQWDCLIDITKSGDILTLTKPFVSKHLRTTMSDVEAAQPLSKLSLEYPDLYIGCYRESRYDSLVICFRGKDQERVESAFETLCKKLPIGAFSNIN